MMASKKIIEKREKFEKLKAEREATRQAERDAIIAQLDGPFEDEAVEAAVREAVLEAVVEDEPDYEVDEVDERIDGDTAADKASNEIWANSESDNESDDDKAPKMAEETAKVIQTIEQRRTARKTFRAQMMESGSAKGNAMMRRSQTASQRQSLTNKGMTKKGKQPVLSETKSNKTFGSRQSTFGVVSDTLDDENSPEKQLEKVQKLNADIKKGEVAAKQALDLKSDGLEMTREKMRLIIVRLRSRKDKVIKNLEAMVDTAIKHVTDLYQEVEEAKANYDSMADRYGDDAAEKEYSIQRDKTQRLRQAYGLMERALSAYKEAIEEEEPTPGMIHSERMEGGIKFNRNRRYLAKTKKVIRLKRHTKKTRKMKRRRQKITKRRRK
jgi:FtsZ-binding cell division protein ZapB